MEILIFDTTNNFLSESLLSSLYRASPVKASYLHWKKTCDRVLEVNKNQVSLKSYSLEIRIDSVNQILKNKEKVA